MKGADDYCDVFKSGEQFGRLYVYPSSHARGRTFAIYLLPEGAVVDDRPWCIKDHVEVYGMVSGQRGWTESYGWIHRGEWVSDFEKILADRIAQIEKSNAERKKTVEQQEVEAEDKLSSLLNSY